MNPYEEISQKSQPQIFLWNWTVALQRTTDTKVDFENLVWCLADIFDEFGNTEPLKREIADSDGSNSLLTSTFFAVGNSTHDGLCFTSFWDDERFQNPLGWLPVSFDSTAIRQTQIHSDRIAIVEEKGYGFPKTVEDTIAINIRSNLPFAEQKNLWQMIANHFCKIGYEDKTLILPAHSTLFALLKNQSEEAALQDLINKKLEAHIKEFESLKKNPSIELNLSNEEHLDFQKWSDLATSKELVTVLNLRGNERGHLPLDLKLFPRLRKLDAAHNRLSVFPDEILSLSHLKNLNLDNNQLIEIPEKIDGLCELETLSLCSNSLKSLPAQIGALKNLQLLHLQSNSLESLPESIGQLQQLEKLYLGSNKLTKLPDSFFAMRNLEYLDLDENQLSELPSGIEKCEKLNQLNIRKNKFTAETVEQIRKLIPKSCVVESDL